MNVIDNRLVTCPAPNRSADYEPLQSKELAADPDVIGEQPAADDPECEGHESAPLVFAMFCTCR